MGIQNFPTALQPAIQQGFLEREFHDGLTSTLAYRSIADREIFPNQIGETVTKTRNGLKAPVTSPMTPANNTNLDNGLSAAGWTIEQYTLGIDMYADTIDLNMITQKVGIADQFLKNARVNGIQSAQTVDRLARASLFRGGKAGSAGSYGSLGGYMGGNTRVTTTLGSAGATIAVDDVLGFEYVAKGADNSMVAVSSTYTATVYVNGTSYTLTGVARDGSNTSTAPGGVSGTLTFSSNVTVANGTAGNAVVHANAPSILRPNSRSGTNTLVSGDKLSLAVILDAVTILRNNAVPTINGFYNCYLDPTSIRELFADDDFKLLFRGTGVSSQEFRSGTVVEILDVRFVPTTEAYQQTLGGLKVHRPIVVGEGALVEGIFSETGYSDVTSDDSMISVVEGIAMITREPLDRLQQIIAQSWYYIGGFALPSDITANSNIIPTASSAYLKRAVVIEHV